MQLSRKDKAERLAKIEELLGDKDEEIVKNAFDNLKLALCGGDKNYDNKKNLFFDLFINDGRFAWTESGYLVMLAMACRVFGWRIFFLLQMSRDWYLPLEIESIVMQLLYGKDLPHLASKKAHDSRLEWGVPQTHKQVSRFTDECMKQYTQRDHDHFLAALQRGITYTLKTPHYQFRVINNGVENIEYYVSTENILQSAFHGLRDVEKNRYLPKLFREWPGLIPGIIYEIAGKNHQTPNRDKTGSPEKKEWLKALAQGIKPRLEVARQFNEVYPYSTGKVTLSYYSLAQRDIKSLVYQLFPQERRRNPRVAHQASEILLGVEWAESLKDSHAQQRPIEPPQYIRKILWIPPSESGQSAEKYQEQRNLFGGSFGYYNSQRGGISEPLGFKDSDFLGDPYSTKIEDVKHIVAAETAYRRNMLSSKPPLSRQGSVMLLDPAIFTCIRNQRLRTFLIKNPEVQHDLLAAILAGGVFFNVINAYENDTSLRLSDREFFSSIVCDFLTPSVRENMPAGSAPNLSALQVNIWRTDIIRQLMPLSGQPRTQESESSTEAGVTELGLEGLNCPSDAGGLYFRNRSGNTSQENISGLSRSASEENIRGLSRGGSKDEIPHLSRSVSDENIPRLRGNELIGLRTGAPAPFVDREDASKSTSNASTRRWRIYCCGVFPEPDQHQEHLAKGIIRQIWANAMATEVSNKRLHKFNLTIIDLRLFDVNSRTEGTLFRAYRKCMRMVADNFKVSEEINTNEMFVYLNNLSGDGEVDLGRKFVQKVLIPKARSNHIALKYYAIHAQAHGQTSSIARRFAQMSPCNPYSPSNNRIRGNADTFSGGTYSDKSAIDLLRSVFIVEFKRLPLSTQSRYQSVHSLWHQLIGHLNHWRNTIPFATLTAILCNAFTQNKDGDTCFELLMGGITGANRTTAALAGVNLCLHLIEWRLDNPKGEPFTRLFDSEGYLNPKALTPEEWRLIRALFDIRLFHFANKYIMDVETNENADIFTECTFQNMPGFSGKDTGAYTVSTH